MSLSELEQRLAELEREVEDLKKKLEPPRLDKRWLETFGTFANDPGFDEMVRLGREWREQANREELP